MQYLLLIYGEEAKEPQPDSPEFGPWMARWAAVSETFEKDGVLVGGQALMPIATATSVKLRDGKTETMDGPFAETKEQLGGYYLLDCPDLDSAVKYAAMLPVAEYGTIEVRPIMTFD